MSGHEDADVEGAQAVLEYQLAVVALAHRPAVVELDIRALTSEMTFPLC